MIGVSPSLELVIDEVICNLSVKIESLIYKGKLALLCKFTIFGNLQRNFTHRIFMTVESPYSKQRLRT